jgi:hypothetical protein
MQLTGKSFRGDVPLSDTHQAVQFAATKAANMAEGHTERLQARGDALEGILGRLIGVLIDNGQLRAEQVCEIFDYDVIALED